nr:7TM diverse intracellular signaling domain-containing protein [uncultured Rhodoferax sp.]
MHPACRHWIILFLGGWLPLSVNASAADKVMQASQLDREPVSLTEYFAVLEDPRLSLTLADVQKPDMASRFKEVETSAAALNFGYSRSAYWLRVHVRNGSERSLAQMLEIRNANLTGVEFHQPLADGSYQSLMTGSVLPFATRPYQSRFFVFPVNLPAHSDQVLYLRLQATTGVIAPVWLWEREAFHAHERDDYVGQAWYFSAATALILFNLLLFIALRDRAYLLYVSFGCTLALTSAAQQGLAKEFLWPDAALWSDISVPIGFSLSLAALSAFMRRMLNTAENLPRFDRLLKLLVGFLLLLPIGFFVALAAIIKPAVLGYALISVLVVGTALFCAYKRQRSAYFFVTAFALFLLGGIMASMRGVGLLPTNMLTVNGLQLGSVMEMLLLAFALGDRFNMIRRKATDDVQQANINLEQRLQARESELTQTHERLREVEQRQMLSQERQRLMQDMHDGLGSSLRTALWSVEKGRMNDTAVADVLKGCIDDLKLAIDSMEPVQADLLLLLATLRFRLEPRLENTGIELLWEVSDVPELNWLDQRSALHILRILQEAFTNIIKHTHASQIHVSTHADAAWVQVSITDNGQGFDLQAARQNGGKGLANQLRRAEAIGAEVDWKSSSEGTSLILNLPLKRCLSTPQEA